MSGRPLDDLDDDDDDVDNFDVGADDNPLEPFPPFPIVDIVFLEVLTIAMDFDIFDDLDFFDIFNFFETFDFFVDREYELPNLFILNDILDFIILMGRGERVGNRGDSVCLDGDGEAPITGASVSNPSTTDGDWVGFATTSAIGIPVGDSVGVMGAAVGDVVAGAKVGLTDGGRVIDGIETVNSAPKFPDEAPTNSPFR